MTGSTELEAQAAFAAEMEGLDAHDEFCEWALEDWAEGDCQCLARAGLKAMAEGQAKKPAPKTRAVAKTPKGPREHTSAKKVRLAAEALGFEVWSVPGDPYIKPASYYASTTDNYKEGDLKTPEKEFARWRIRGRHQALPTTLAFDASWADGFMGGRIMDPGGKEIELRANYYYSPGQIKNYGYTKEYAEKVGQERTARYDDGGTMTVDRWEVKTFAEFTEWIDDLIDLLRVDYPKITTKRAPSKKKTEEGIMHELLNPKVDYSL
ncbi:hypothetical protein SEA_PLATTE_58 [Microbacterium phage Platte]|nr:hypothetical protein SEA_HORTUS1_58 [Microbacterium phage Hortus1]AWY05629.1 hypothetical protein SEA_OLINDD_58 [Microbacterium phage OlinDD]QZD97651.1 hypothetical protein SEA_PLATTE_58 [Microbacterium phage Platte]